MDKVTCQAAWLHALTQADSHSKSQADSYAAAKGVSALHGKMHFAASPQLAWIIVYKTPCEG